MSNTWFRYHIDALNDPKVQTLPTEIFKVWVNCLCVACNGDGKLGNVSSVSFALRETIESVSSAFHVLTERGLLVTDGETFHIKNWNKRQYKSDVSTERVKRHRKRSRNVSETPPDTDSDTDTESKGDAQARDPAPPPKVDVFTFSKSTMISLQQRQRKGEALTPEENKYLAWAVVEDGKRAGIAAPPSARTLTAEELEAAEYRGLKIRNGSGLYVSDRDKKRFEELRKKYELKTINQPSEIQGGSHA